MYRELEKLAFEADEFSERLLQREKELAAARGAKYTPGMRMSDYPTRHPTLEKEILKGTGPSVGQKVKYHTVGRLRRAFMQPGKYRTLRRAGILGGAAGLGLLGKAWYDSAQNEKAINKMHAEASLGKYSAQFDYTPNAPVTPKPAKFPSMPAPMSTNAGMPTTPKPLKAPGKVQKYTGESAEMKIATTNDILSKVAFLDEGVGPLLYGAAGGAGGYYLGKKVLDPIMSLGQENLRRKIHITEKIIEGLEKGKKVAPVASATVGAILLAALAAKRAKAKERERMEMVEAMGGVPREGFYPEDRRSTDDPTAAFYG